MYLLVMTGDMDAARKFVDDRYPGHTCIILSKRELRDCAWREQVRRLRKLRGEALVFFFHSLADLQEPQLTIWSSVLHRCRVTELADSSGQIQTYSRLGLVRLLPKTAVSAVSDLIVLVVGWVWLLWLRTKTDPIAFENRHDADFDLAYLYPYPTDFALAGGALSHVEGFLSGVAAAGGRCEIISGRSLPVHGFPLHIVPSKRKFFIFRESLLLSYNLRFVAEAKRILRNRRPRAIYQRHGRFVVVGALLARSLGIPLILEYNGSEVFVSKHWSASRFHRWLRDCEEISVRRAQQNVVVSQPLKQELIDRGIPESRILLNPNAVNPGVFKPDSGGHEVRQQLAFADDNVVVAFLGTFDHWHGVSVLADAIQRLLQDSENGLLRFLIIGEGRLYAETQRKLSDFVGQQVIFTGLVPHQRVPSYLDAADILVSPHVPMPDGRPFFGSPTKLFEYMAMAKGIVASNLDQLSEVLEHQTSAWLVEPGNVSELASAIVLLARDPELRARLGQNARASAIAKHTWEQNAKRVLAYFGQAESCQLIDTMAGEGNYKALEHSYDPFSRRTRN